MILKVELIKFLDYVKEENKKRDGQQNVWAGLLINIYWERKSSKYGRKRNKKENVVSMMSLL